MRSIKISETGLCGRACGFCRHYQKECRGCRKENARNPVCIIYKCAKKIKVSLCLQCHKMPCELQRKLLGSYCPCYDKIVHKF